MSWPKKFEADLVDAQKWWSACLSDTTLESNWLERVQHIEAYIGWCRDERELEPALKLYERSKLFEEFLNWMEEKSKTGRNSKGDLAKFRVDRNGHLSTAIHVLKWLNRME